MKKFGTLSGSLLLVFAFVATTGFVARAHADAMECLISVYNASDLVNEAADPVQSSQVVSMPLVDGNADLEVQVNGQTVWFSVWKFEHTDMYNFTAALTTPTADIPPRGPNAVAIITDYLFNDGPTKENGWDLNPGPNATRFSYLNRQSGTFAMSTKLIAALKTAGKWGVYPFNSIQMDVQSMFPLVDFVKDQLAAKTMLPTDVVGMSTVFTCSLQK